MASRTKQKEEARARRLAEERARAERSRRQRRLQMIGGTVLAAIVVVVVAIVVSSSGGSKAQAVNPASATAKQDAVQVSSLLAGIPQSGNRLGAANAPVTVTEFGDLECPICKSFASGAEKTLIDKDVRSGKVKLVYKSLETATGNGPNASMFGTQQAAALAAGLQGLGWHYILLFYAEQGSETSAYVNVGFLNGLAKQLSGLNYSKWLSDRGSTTLTNQVTTDEQEAASKGFNSTPTVVVQGPKGVAQPIIGDNPYNTYESEIKSVS